MTPKLQATLKTGSADNLQAETACFKASLIISCMARVSGTWIRKSTTVTEKMQIPNLVRCTRTPRIYMYVFNLINRDGLSRVKR